MPGMLRAFKNKLRYSATYAAQRCYTCLTEGQSWRTYRQFTTEDVLAFTDLTGDTNPIHVDNKKARANGVQHAVVPGMLMASLFPAIIGSNFPGALYATQTLKFRNQAEMGSAVTAEVTVLKASGSRVLFQTLCKSDQGHILVEGTALAIIKQKHAS